MSKSISVNEQSVISKIYLLRGQKVMLDRDLAELYGVETRRLNEQVKRNAERLPENFMFRLTEQEVEGMVSKCDTIQTGTWWFPPSCLYGAWRTHAGQCAEEQ